MRSASFFDTNPYQQEQEDIARRRAYAEALQAEGMKPSETKMVGGWAIPNSPLEGINKVAQSLVGALGQNELRNESLGLQDRYRSELTRALGDMPRASQRAAATDQEGTGAFDMAGTTGPRVEMVQPTMAQNSAWLGQLAQLGPQAMGIGTTVLGMQQKADENEANRQAKALDRLMALEAKAADQAAAREARAAAAQEAAELRRELQSSQQDFARQQAEAQRSFMAQQGVIARQDRNANRQPQVIQGADGPMVLGPNNQATHVLGPDGQPVKGKSIEKALPTSAAQKLFENQQNLRRAEQALSLIDSNPDATGFKGYIPDAILQRTDPAGVATRAAIADLGSLVIHDRSGAAVTAAEYPRLRPFIPLPTDDAATVKTKLGRFKTEYQNVVNETSDFYRESGYKVPTGVLRGGDSQSTNPQRRSTDKLSDAETRELEELRKKLNRQ